MRCAAKLSISNPGDVASIKSAAPRISVTTDSDLLYHDEIHGDLFSQVEKTLDLLLTKYLKAGISYEGPQRVEEFPIPENALREAVINAIAHKDYASANPMQISAYADKLMIWNPGHLPQN